MRTSFTVRAIPCEFRDVLERLLFGFTVLSPTLYHTTGARVMAFLLTFEAIPQKQCKFHSTLQRNSDLSHQNEFPQLQVTVQFNFTVAFTAY